MDVRKLQVGHQKQRKHVNNVLAYLPVYSFDPSGSPLKEKGAGLDIWQNTTHYLNNSIVQQQMILQLNNCKDPSSLAKVP